MNFFKLSLKLKGFPIDRTQGDIERLGKTHSAIFKCRENIFQYHLKYNSFYKKLLYDTQVSTWEDIPILTKDMLHAPLNERVSENYRHKKLHKAKTSGSSGFPFSYAKDNYCHALTWAHILKAYKEIGIDYGRDYQARFYGIPKAGKVQIIEHFKDKLSKRKRLVIFDLTDNKLDEFVNIFKTHKFDYIYGYSSAIVLMAKHLKTKNLKLKEICPSVKICITTSEMLFPADRALLEEQFEVPVYNEYGASEFGIIAIENTKRQFILNDKTIYIEIVDKYGNLLPDGEVGRIIVTSIYNKAHPFIRYDLGDFGAISKDNANGQKVLSKLAGRTNEFALLRNGKRVPAFTFYYIAKSVSYQIESIKELKVIQYQNNSFRLEYTGVRALTADEKQLIQNAFYTYLEIQVNLKFEQKRHLERSKSGKLQQFETRL